MSSHATPTGRPLRADARRNYERILAAAGEAFTKYGANASLEEIARQAGVGSATLHRHFASRRALLSAVFHDRVEGLCAQAYELTRQAEPGVALSTWLRTLGAYASTTRGLAASLVPDVREGELPTDNACAVMIDDAGQYLLRRAQQAGAVRRDVTFYDLLTLVNAIALAAEHGTEGPAQAERLLALVIGGISSERPESLS